MQGSLVCEKPQRLQELSGESETEKGRPSILLHSCCGPCSTAVIEKLAQRYSITVYFANSNIDDEGEYRKRLEAQKKFLDRYNASLDAPAPVALVVAEYRPLAFLKSVEGLEDEPEGRRRCRVCIAGRIEKTAAFAAMNGFSSFTTTLSVSPHKSYDMIARAGKEHEVRYGVQFLAEDYKKGNGFGRSVELAGKYGLYRQDYCGCRFSKRRDESMDETKERGGR